MARLVAVVLFLTLALAPAASAEAPDRGDSPFFGWLDAFRATVDRIFSWVPALRPDPRGHGAMIIPGGLQAAPRENGATIIPSGLQAASRRNGAMIIPNGVRSDPDSREKPRLRGRAAVQRVD